MHMVYGIERHMAYSYILLGLGYDMVHGQRTVGSKYRPLIPALTCFFLVWVGLKSVGCGSGYGMYRVYKDSRLLGGPGYLELDYDSTFKPIIA